jgi:hypothetical protein
MLKELLVEGIYFTIILAILFLYTTFLIARGSLTDNRFKNKWWKRVNSRGWTVIVVNIIIIIIYIFQSVNNSNWIEIKNAELKKEQDERAEIIQKEVKKEMDKIFNSISIAFANQEIKIDSLQQFISNQKNINHITNNRIIENEPYLHIKSNTLKIENDGIYFGMYAKDANVTNINAKYTVLVIWSDGNKEIFKQPFLTPDITIPANKEVTNIKLVDFKNKILRAEQMFIQFKGTYTNLQNSKEFPFEFVFSYDKKKKIFLNQFNKERDSILKLMLLK